MILPGDGSKLDGAVAKDALLLQPLKNLIQSSLVDGKLRGLRELWPCTCRVDGSKTLARLSLIHAIASAALVEEY